MNNSKNGVAIAERKMKGAFQGHDEIIIQAPIESIWQVLIDGNQLSRWMKIVKHTTSATECLHAVRSCDVEMNGKTGKVEEKCVLYEEHKQIGWEMMTDTFGFSRMFDHYGFSFELKKLDTERTLVINRGFYNPKNLVVSLLNVLVMRKKTSSIRRIALSGLKQVAESNAVLLSSNG